MVSLGGLCRHRSVSRSLRNLLPQVKVRTLDVLSIKLPPHGSLASVNRLQPMVCIYKTTCKSMTAKPHVRLTHTVQYNPLFLSLQCPLCRYHTTPTLGSGTCLTADGMNYLLVPHPRLLDILVFLR